MATREQVEAAVIARLSTVSAYTTDQVNAEGFDFPDGYAEVRVSPTSRGLAKGSATSPTQGWQVDIEVVGRLAVNVNRVLDTCSSLLYGHRFTIGSDISTPCQEGGFEPAESTGDRRFAGFGSWTFAL